MPPAIGGLLLAAGATFGGALAAGATVGTAAILAGISFGTGMIRKFVFGNRPSQEGIKRNVASGEATMPIIYGTSKVGAKLLDTRVDPDSEKNKNLYRVAALCVGSEDGSGIEGLAKVWFDERLAIDGAVEGDLDTAYYFANPDARAVKNKVDPFHDNFTYGFQRGTDAQTVDSDLNTIFPDAWPTEARVRGIAYLALMLEHDKEQWQGIPNVTAEVDGNHVYDPRDGTWKHSDNPALCILDYLTSDRYGYGETYTQRDGGSKPTRIDEQSFIDAANLYDELVSGPNPDTGSMERRFTCNIWLDTGNSLDENLDALLSTCRGTVIDQNGKLRLKTRVATDPVDFTLDPSNIIGEWRWIRDGSDEVPNSISVRYPSAEDDHAIQEVVWPEHDSNDFLTSDNDELNQIEAELPGTTNHRRAQEIGMVMLKEAREDVTIEVTCTEEALQLEYGDLVPVTHPTPGWEDKEFWVGSVEVLPPEEGGEGEPGQPTRVRLGLREYSDLAYSYDPLSDKPTVPGTNLPDPFVLADPTNVSAASSSGTAVELGDGTEAPRILVSWTPPSDAFYDEARVRYRPVVDADGGSVSENWQIGPTVDSNDDQQLYLDQVKAGWEYEVQVQAVNTIGTTSSWVAAPNVTATTTGAIAPIIKPTSSESDDGTQGTLDVEVIDPAGGKIDVEFFKRVGTGGYPASADKTVNGVASSNTASYTFALDGDKPTFVRVVATLQSNSNTNSLEVTFGSGINPKIENLQATIDADTSEAFVSAAGNSDTEKIYIKVGDGSSPVDPTPANADATISGQSGSVNTGVQISDGNRAFVKAVGESSTATNNQLGPVQETTAGPDAGGQPNILTNTFEAVDGTSGTLEATPIDPNGGTLTVRFYTRQGHEGYPSTPDAEFTGVSSGVTKNHSVSLIEEKNSWIKVEAEVESNGKKADREVAFDPDKTATIEHLSGHIDDDGIGHVRVGGDSDTTEIDLVLGAPINETHTITGREGTYDSTAAADPGDEVTVTATPKNADGVAGPDRAIDIDRSGTGTSDVTPRPTVERTGVTVSGVPEITYDYTIGAEAGQAGDAGSLEIRYRVNGPDGQMGTYSAWKSAPEDISVSADLKQDLELEVAARDTSLPSNPESAAVTREVPSVRAYVTENGQIDPDFPLDDGDFPGRDGGKGDSEVQKHKSGTWDDGEGVGGGSFDGRPGGTRTATGLGQLLDTISGLVGGDLAYQSGDGVDAKEPAEADSEQTSGKSLTVLIDRLAGNIDYQDNTAVEDLQPDEAGSEQTTGKSLTVLTDRLADKLEYLDGTVMENLEPAEADSEQTAGKSLTVLTDLFADKLDYLDGTVMENLQPSESDAEQTAGKDLGILSGLTADKLDRLADSASLEDVIALLTAAGRVQADEPLDDGDFPGGDKSKGDTASDDAASGQKNDGKGVGGDSVVAVPGGLVPSSGVGDLVKTDTGTVGSDLSYGSGDGVDAKEPAEADSEQTAGKSLTVLIDLLAGNIDYADNTAVENLQPAEADSEITSGKDWAVMSGQEADVLSYLDGTVAENLQPAEDGAEVTAGKDMAVLSGREADAIEYLDGTLVEDLEPSESGAEQTAGKSLSVLVDLFSSNLQRSSSDTTTVKDILQLLRADGSGNQDFGKYDGAFNLPPGIGFEVGTCRHGDGVSFDVDRNDTPEVIFLMGGGLVNHSNLSGDYGPQFKALNPSADGFTADLHLQGTASNITNRSISSWTDPGGTQDFEATKSQTAEAWDDQYNLRAHLFIAGNSFDGECFGSSADLEWYYNKGSGWVLAKTTTHQSGCNDFDSDVQQTLTVDGMGGNTEFGVSHVGAGSMSQPNIGDAVEWEEASDPPSEIATPDGASDIVYMALA